jgi:hypothetical protein
MKAQIFGPVVDPAAGAGTGYTLNSGKTVTYWIEERVKDTHGNIVRRSASTVAQVTPITGTGAVVKPRIYRPVVPANADATHWAVFATATNGTFPTGAEIAEEDISDTYIDDANTTTDPPLPLGSPYSILQTTIAGVIQSVARYGPAPVASTGDVYKSCLCINDVANPRRMWFSFYRTPQAYPANNYFEFDGKEHDTITCIRTAGNVLVVLLKESAWRVTDLPFPEDADQTPDNYKERVEGAFGCVGPLATAYIPLPASEYPRSSLLLAYVSRYGLMATDGSAWWHLSRDLDWPGAFDLSQLATARLLNNARKFRLELYALDPSGNRIAYYFAYHPSHLKPGMRLKVTGPIHRDATAAVMVRLNGLLVPFTAAANKVIYQNDVGTSEPAYTGGIQFMVRSGVSYPFGVGNEGIIRRVLVHHGAGVVGQTAAVRVRQYNEKRSTVAASGYISLTKNEGTSTMNGCAGEAFDISVENSDTLGAFRVNMYALVEQSAGEAQPA